MKEKLIFTKVHETLRQRFYKLSIPVTKAPNPHYDWDKERAYNLSRLKEEYKHLNPSAIEYVCVSDAHTHIERLLFVAVPMNKEKTDFSSLCGKQLDGRHTFMIHGGNSRDVHPDEVYLRRLSKANGYEFKMSDNETKESG